MIVLDCKQGSSEWFKARLGIPTASQFRRILTTKTRKVSSQAETYMHELLAEWLIGIPHDADASGFMARGRELEPAAVAWYEYTRDIETRAVGCALTDDRMVACSPDRLVGEDGGLEIKCPRASEHVANMLTQPDEYVAQVQGCMWITGARWWDLVSFNPDLPPVVYRIERDEDYIRALASAVAEFRSGLLAARAVLIARGCVPATTIALPAGLVRPDEEPF